MRRGVSVLVLKVATPARERAGADVGGAVEEGHSPVGVPEPGETAATVAVNVTD